MASVIIPAHNEETGVHRLLAALGEGIIAGDYDVLVVCNGCTDDTADVARSAPFQVSVMDLPEPSKAKALKAGDRLARSFPRFYIDADVIIDTASMRALISALDFPGILAVAPRRKLDRTGVGWLARCYYDVWEQLPVVNSGLFGRGVIGVNEAGFDRVLTLPERMSDDLAMSEAFAISERAVVQQALVEVLPARTWRALLNRRVRAVAGSRALMAEGLASPASRTGVRDVLQLVRRSPSLTGRALVFIATGVATRVLVLYRRRRGNLTEWRRDETSRQRAL